MENIQRSVETLKETVPTDNQSILRHTRNLLQQHQAELTDWPGMKEDTDQALPPTTP